MLIQKLLTEDEFVDLSLFLPIVCLNYYFSQEEELKGQ